LNIRGRALSVASSANWGSDWLVALTFPVLLAALGGPDAFRLFVALGIAAWFFVYFRVPEHTQGEGSRIPGRACRVQPGGVI
jgi:SP family galactose:H+ symporter-like MFS transporter